MALQNPYFLTGGGGVGWPAMMNILGVRAAFQEKKRKEKARGLGWGDIPGVLDAVSHILMHQNMDVSENSGGNPPPNHPF